MIDAYALEKYLASNPDYKGDFILLTIIIFFIFIIMAISFIVIARLDKKEEGGIKNESRRRKGRDSSKD